MSPIPKEDARAYRSELREQQAEGTRRRILDATVRVIAGGLADVTVPAVARAAEVSVPTVYRHFGTKRDLLAALQPHLQQQAGIDRILPPRSLDELRGTLEMLIGGMDNLDDVTRAALASPASDAVRRVHAPNRLRLARTLVDGIVEGLSEVDRERIARLFVILTTSAALRMWRDDFGASVEQIADDVDRALRAAIAAAAGESVG